MKEARLSWLAGPSLPRPLPPAHVWVVQPAHASAALAAAGPSGRPRVVVEGTLPEIPADAAVLEGEGTASAVQRALQLGAGVVVVPRGVRGAGLVGGAAWYHGWRVDSDRSALAGALVAAVACRAAVLGRGALPHVAIDAAGSSVVSPVDRSGTIARLLLEPGAGPAMPEVLVNLESVHVLDAGDGSLRITGTRSAGATGSTTGPQVRFRGQVHAIPPVPPARGSNVPLDLGERTMPVAPVAADGPVRPASEVVRAWTADHERHTVLVVSARQPDDWPLLEEWASAPRAAAWFSAQTVVRQPFANLSAIRFVCAAPDRAPATAVVDRVLTDSVGE